MAQEPAPTLENFGLDESVYRDYRVNRERLAALKASYEVKGWVIFLCVAVVVLCLSLSLGANLLYSSLFVFWSGLISLSFSERISNICSGGKYKETESLLQALEASFLDKIRPFEKAAKEYFENELREFYENNLFRKRSGTEKFDGALAEFASMLDELHKANKIFKTTNFHLKKYDDYLFDRRIGHAVRQSSGESHFNELNRLTSTNKSIRKDILAPERLYALPRKIDWDEVNKARRITGLKGEEIVVLLERDYLTSIHRADLAARVVHVSQVHGDGIGYDVLSFTSNGQEKYIEVKSTTGATEAGFYISSNEFSFLKQNVDRSYIYRIANILDENQTTLKVYSAGEVLNATSIVPTQFLIRMH